MKKILVLALATAAIPAISQGFVDGHVNRHADGFEDAGFLSGVGREFGLDTSVLSDMRQRYGYDGNELLMALTLQRDTRRSQGDINQLRRKGMDWDEIARALGINTDGFDRFKSRDHTHRGRDPFELGRQRISDLMRSWDDPNRGRRQRISFEDAYRAYLANANDGRAWPNLAGNNDRRRSPGFSPKPKDEQRNGGGFLDRLNERKADDQTKKKGWGDR